MARPVGRPSKLNPITKSILISSIKGCNTLESSCAIAGISYRTLMNWQERGKDSQSGEFFQFLQELEMAKATAEVQLVGIIVLAAQREWKAAAFILERRNPRVWGKTPLVEESSICDQSQFDENREYLNAIAENEEATNAFFTLRSFNSKWLKSREESKVSKD